ncbi:hypothetical protein NRB_09710 [Novosphingobium sp. 11B]
MMNNPNEKARQDFRRMMRLIVAVAIVASVAAVAYIGMFTPLNFVIVTATGMGVFFSIIVGSGLLALSFFSNHSGADDAVNSATESQRGGETPD